MHTPVHPRGHGEHQLRLKWLWMGVGSSPWARGTPFSAYFKKAISRFIPVGTGNTGIERVTNQLLAVHPRGHGEHIHHRFYSD